MRSLIRLIASSTLVTLSSLAPAAEPFTPLNIFVTCTDGKVVELWPGGVFRREWTVAPIGHNLGGIVFGPYGDLYVGDLTSNRILRLTPDGHVKPIEVKGLAYPIDFAIDGDDGFYVASRDEKMIRRFRFHPEGITEAEPAASAAIGCPSGIEVAPDGSAYLTSLWVSGSTSMLRRLDSKLRVVIDEKKFKEPTAVCIGIEATYVADRVEGVLRGSIGGTFTRIELPELAGAHDVTRYANGNLIAVSLDGGRFVEFTPAGEIVNPLSSLYLPSPRRVAVAPSRFIVRLYPKTVSTISDKKTAPKREAIVVVSPHSGYVQLAIQKDLQSLGMPASQYVFNFHGDTIMGPSGTMMIHGMQHEADPLIGRASILLEPDVFPAQLPYPPELLSVTGRVDVTAAAPEFDWLSAATIKTKTLIE